MNDEQIIKEWLDECRTENTRLSYKHSIEVFQQWYKKPLSEFLALDTKEMRHVALKFQNEPHPHIDKKGREIGVMRQNSVSSVLTALGSLVSQNGKTLQLRGKRLRTQIDLDSHVFTNGDLVSLFDLGDTQEKAILAAFTSLGWEVASVLGLKRSFIDGLIRKARADRQEYVYFHNQRGKTGALRLGVLNPLALEWLEKWLIEWHGESLFMLKTKCGVNRMMRRLAKEAQIKTTGRVHSHLIRKWVMSGLSRAGFNDFQIKYVMGKSIPVSDGTYLQTLETEIEERYPGAYENYLNIKHAPAVMASLSKSLDAKDKEIADLKDRMARLEQILQGIVTAKKDVEAELKKP
jgi:hypothetical protein